MYEANSATLLPVAKYMRQGIQKRRLAATHNVTKNNAKKPRKVRVVEVIVRILVGRWV